MRTRPPPAHENSLRAPKLVEGALRSALRTEARTETRSAALAPGLLETSPNREERVAADLPPALRAPN